MQRLLLLLRRAPCFERGGNKCNFLRKGHLYMLSLFLVASSETEGQWTRLLFLATNHETLSEYCTVNILTVYSSS